MKPKVKSILRFALIPIFVLIAGLAMAQPTLASPNRPDALVPADSISGQVIGGGGATLSYFDGSAKTVTADGSGNYSILVPSGWTGTVTPSMPGHSFTPSSIAYSTPVTTELTGQNYTAILFTPTPTPTITRTPTPTTVKTQTATPTTPAGFSKIYPWDGATGIVASSVTLKWKAYSGSFEKYRYCYDTVPGSQCVGNPGWTSVSKSSTSVTVTLAANTVYYWHVQAVVCSLCKPKTIVDTNSGAWWAFSTGKAATPTPTPTVTPTPTATPFSATYPSIGTDDGWVLESAPKSGVGGTLNSTNGTFLLGDTASNLQYRAILSFDTSSLPDTAHIVSVVLKIKQSGPRIGVNPFSVLGNLWVDIRNGVFGSSEALELADFNAAASAGKVGFFKPPVNGWYSANLNGVGRSNVNTTGLTQVRLYFAIASNNNHLVNLLRFLSGDAATAKPMLLITYSLP